MTIISRSTTRFFTRGAFDGSFHLPVGTTKTIGSPANLPVRRRVRLHDQVTGAVVREIWSDSATGSFQFRSLVAGIYTVTAFDHTGMHGGEIETDIVVPTP